MVEKRKIVAVHPKDARGYCKEKLIGRVGYWVDGLQTWKYTEPVGYEHGVFRFLNKAYNGLREISCYAISTVPVKEGG